MPHLAPAGAYQTFQILAPRSTHFRRATCAEVNCPDYTNGWRTTLPANSDLIEVVRKSGRRITAEYATEDGQLAFVFEPGQPCFRSDSHRVRLDRPELFIVRGGDDRGNPRGTRRRHANAADWVDDFATHQDKLSKEAGNA